MERLTKVMDKYLSEAKKKYSADTKKKVLTLSVEEHWTFPNEVWKSVEGWKRLEVSNLGRVRSLFTHRILRQTIRANGYYYISACENGVEKGLRVHRMVAKIPNPENKEQINHIDSNRLNNNVDNLEWVTCKENHQRSGYGEHLSKSQRASTKKKRRKIAQYDLNGNYITTFSSFCDMNRKTGFGIGCVFHCCRGTKGIKQSHGYIWKFAD